MPKRGWLDQRIQESREEMEKWPDWMKETARFEGAAREGEARTSSQSKVSTEDPADVEASD